MNKLIHPIDPTNLSPEDEILLGLILIEIKKDIPINGIILMPKFHSHQLAKLTETQRKYTHIDLTKILRCRNCQSGFNKWHFDVYADAVLGSGSNGTVEKLLGSIAVKQDERAVFAPKLYVAKIQETTSSKQKKIRRLQKIVIQEFALSKPVRELRMKPPTFFADGSTVLVMKYIEGETIKEFAKKDKLERKQNVNTTSTDKRLQVSMLAARKLHMLHLQNILHRDLKPANIMIDFAKQEVASTIFDLGLATNINQPDGFFVGTPLYAPLEYYRRNVPLTPKSDIFYLGWDFNFIWRGNENKVSTMVEAEKFAANCTATGLFRGIDDISNDHKILLKNMIDAMFRAKPEERPDLPLILGDLEKIHLERTLAKIDPDYKKEFETAHVAGIELRYALDKLLVANTSITLAGIEQISSQLTATFNSLTLTSLDALKEFIDRSYVGFWHGFTSLESLIADTNTLLKNYQQNVESISVLLNEVKNFKEWIATSGINGQQSAKLEHINRHLERALLLQNVYMSIDEIAIVYAKMKKYVDVYRPQLEELKKNILQDDNAIDFNVDKTDEAAEQSNQGKETIEMSETEFQADETEVPEVSLTDSVVIKIDNPKKVSTPKLNNSSSGSIALTASSTFFGSSRLSGYLTASDQAAEELTDSAIETKLSEYLPLAKH